MNNKTRLFLYIMVINSLLKSQHLIFADPVNIIKYEQKISFGDEIHRSLILRPLLYKPLKNNLTIITRNEFFINDNGPNLENMGNRWIGKGASYFSGLNISYFNNFISFTIEPYYFFNQNLFVKNINREVHHKSDIGVFTVLNDNRYFTNQPYVSYGFRESQLFFHYKEFGFGISNANMWWGPSIHTSLTMSNNTTGFPYLMIGTLNEKQIFNMDINVRYIFAQLNKVLGNPYYTALVGTARFYTQPIITLGLSRNYLSGGLPTDRLFTIWDAALLPFESLFIDKKIKDYPSEWEAHDPWDETMAGFVSLHFPNSGLQLFIELGTDDHRQNWMDLRSQPDHNSASIIGLRKYGLFNNKFLLGGFEYANIKRAYSYIFRGNFHYWNSYFYDYSSYDGRRWAAHSGSDSDDFYLFIGYNNSGWTFIPGFNYERHGITSGNPPEIKIEFRLDVGFIYKNYRINIYYEKELLNNTGFVPDKVRMSNVFWFGIEKYLNDFVYKSSN